VSIVLRRKADRHFLSEECAKIKRRTAFSRSALTKADRRAALGPGRPILPIESPNCDLGHLTFRKPVAWFVCFEGGTPMKKILVITAVVLFLVAHGTVAAIAIYSPLGIADTCDGSGC